MKNLLNKFRKDNKGFTLVELIIVIAILAVLMAVLAPQYIRYVEKSRQGTDASALNEIKHAVEIEAALVEDVTAFNITIDPDAADADDVIATTDAGAGATIVSQVKLTVPNVEFKSDVTKAGTFTISVSNDGVVTWKTDDTALGDMSSEELVADLAAGTAEKPAA